MLSLVAAAFICLFVQEGAGSPQRSEACDQRYFQHYVVKGCEPVFDRQKSCPTRFNCPDTIPYEAPEGCKFKGKTYLPGADIPSSNPCQICKCRQISRGDIPDITCTGVECASAFGPPLNDSCREIYEKEACCSTRTECGEEDSPSHTCDHDGRTYLPGERIYPDSDPCAVCTCGPGWTGDVRTDENCRRLDCILESRKDELKRGCVPIYHEGSCCPIEYYCGENLPKTNTPLASDEDIESGNTCVFKGSHYRLGQDLDIDHPTHCVTCTCTTPPEFTCIHQSCKWPEDQDCVPSYSNDACCPTFDCTVKVAVSV